MKLIVKQNCHSYVNTPLPSLLQLGLTENAPAMISQTLIKTTNIAIILNLPILYLGMIHKEPVKHMEMERVLPVFIQKT